MVFDELESLRELEI